MEDHDCVIRAATLADAVTILRFVRELAAYEKLLHEVTASEAALAAALFGPRASAACIMAEAAGEPVGFALYYFTLSTFAGTPSLFIEDIYVRPEQRGRGIGMRLFRELARIALARDCGRIEWRVLDWNAPALDFYRRLGATPLTDWTVERLPRERIEALARGDDIAKL